jgi:mannose-6-phosphate isomerase-like protein (cupin superfamily)
VFIKDIARSTYFKALDETLLCELLHPFHEKENIQVGFSLAHAILKPGQRSRPHKLKNASEVYYILEGEGRLAIGDETVAVKAGQAVYIPPDAVQSLENIGPGNLKFLCLVCPPWQATDEEVSKEEEENDQAVRCDQK